MKKKLEADLISIAHKVLQMKNKSDINQLLIETQKLQEKLSVLKFIEELLFLFLWWVGTKITS